jgi:hypothetical protein
VSVAEGKTHARPAAPVGGGQVASRVTATPPFQHWNAGGSATSVCVSVGSVLVEAPGPPSFALSLPSRSCAVESDSGSSSPNRSSTPPAPRRAAIRAATASNTIGARLRPDGSAPYDGGGVGDTGGEGG